MSATLAARGTRRHGGRLLAALAVQVTHDLNNHLAAALGKAEFGLLVADPERKTAALSGVLEAGDAARRLVTDLQRLGAWLEGAGDPVQPAEIALLATRLLDRRLRRAAVRTACRGTGLCPSRPRAALGALALWSVLRRLLDAPAGEPSRAWDLHVHADGREDEIAIRIEGAPVPRGALDDLEDPLQDAGAQLLRERGTLVVLLP